MKHPDGTPLTPDEWQAERTRRWEQISQRQRSAHPISPEALPLFKRYADGELTLEEVREGLHRLYNRRRFPEGPDGPEVPEPPPAPAPPATEELVVHEGAMFMLPDPPPLSREARIEMLERWIERRKQENPDDPWIGKWVTFTASAYPKATEDELN
ncbi:antitoxin VbhA family protein [Deinococcus sp. MIMF12]|uniref:Antitoxin VbhA family protein n=1 Tax=Deinococcus rhizophilus TaxID=3049544 RepID=A0ABT7JI15_9DEIO|nr:antitoxin VbhA family protein [Deinococcus rhizophilus]MDL2344222.1 antitoxin VbhA family protein [Deinococcus rhizophilus]